MAAIPPSALPRPQVAQAVIGSSQAPGSNGVSIGAIKLNSSEAPTTLAVGAEQMTVTQTLAGGTRVVQTFGLSPDEISWTGKLFGAFVQSRVAQLRLYLSSGNPVKFSWVKSTIDLGTGAAISQLKEQYTVIVKKFIPTFYAQYAEYNITLIVVSADNGAYAASPPASIDTQINALQSKAVVLTNTLIASSVSQTAAIAQYMSETNSAIAAATPISQNPLAASGIQTSIANAQKAISSFQSKISNGSSLYPVSIQLSGILSAISRNITAGYAPNTVTQQGGNLFSIAARVYGDPSAAFSLASVAGFSSPFLPSGVFSLVKLPNLTPSN